MNKYFEDRAIKEGFNKNFPKINTGKLRNRVIIDQITLEELRAQFESIYHSIDLRQKNEKYRNDITRMVWSGYHKCAKTNNILSEG